MRSLDALERFQMAGSDRVHERLIVALVLVSVALREVGERCVELIAFVQAGAARRVLVIFDHPYNADLCGVVAVSTVRVPVRRLSRYVCRCCSE